MVRLTHDSGDPFYVRAEDIRVILTRAYGAAGACVILTSGRGYNCRETPEEIADTIYIMEDRK